MKRKSWTTSEEKLLLSMHSEGMTDAEIARQLGRTVYSVQNRRQSLGREKVPDERLILKYVAELAYRLGVSKHAAARRVVTMYRRGAFDDV